MSSRRKEKTASKLDHKQEVYYPLDYSFKTLNVFEGKMKCLSMSIANHWYVTSSLLMAGTPE